MIRSVSALLLFAVSVAAQDPCADGTYDPGTVFAVGDCNSQYYECNNGQQILRSCGAGTVFNPDKDACDHTISVEGCRNVDTIDCNNQAYNGQSYTKPGNCETGTYYTCIGGIETETSCASGLVFNTAIGQCVWTGTIDCTSTSVGGNSDDPSLDTTTTTNAETTTTTATTTTTTTPTITSTAIVLDFCADGTHEGAVFPVGDCDVQYYQCGSDGQQYILRCGAGTVFNPDNGICDHTISVAACKDIDSVDCSNPAYTGQSYTKADNCETGTYYTCINGVETEASCAAGMVFNTATGQCTRDGTIDCTATSPGGNSDDPSLDTTTTTEGATPTTSIVTTTPTTSPTTTVLDLCADGTHEGAKFPVGDCDVQYYQCGSNGQQHLMRCGTGTVFNPDNGRCDHIISVEACTDVDSIDCNNQVYNGQSYTKADDCETGTYYTCINGVENETSCDPGMVFNTVSGQCTWDDGTINCKETSPGGNSTTTTTTTTTTPTTTSSSIVLDTDEPTPPDEITKPELPFTTEEAATKTSHTEGPTGGPAITTEESTTAIATEAATTTAIPPGDTYVGFVVDDTGSMSNEIAAVKEWISNCVSGSSTSCGQSPTGGWIVTSFNDPFVGRVVGPTMDTDAIIAEVGGYFAHGGGNCPEMAFSGLENAVNVVPDVHSGCKMYFFTDATAIDYTKSDSVTKLYEDKGCAFIPILTGCCGTCPDACESTSTEYCEEHISDSRGTTSYRLAKRSTSDSIETLFYKMSEDTGGNIYVTDKPSSPDEMLDFLEEEVTMGFCATSDIAGPAPDGYKCEDDCLAKKMCWDRSVSKCYCEGSIPCAYESVMYSMCPGEQIVVCEENVPVRVEPDQKNCNKYYQCNFGEKHHFACANGTVFSTDVSSNCDHPENVDPPCGTRGVVV